MDPKKRQRSKSFSVLEGSFNSSASGFTSNFMSAFAVALGASNTVIALLSTLPALIGAIVQLWVQQISSFFKTRKRHIIFFAMLQSFMWLPLIFAPQLHNPGGWLLFFVTLNTVFGMLISPVWNSYMGDLVEEEERGRFFGRRNMFTGLTAFISTICAGWILGTLKPVNPFLGFGILFSLAFLFRLTSAFYLSKMDDPPERGLSTEGPDVEEFLMNAEKTPFGRFTIFLMLFYVAVYISAPFFVVYQLSILKFDYFTFTLLTASSAITSFISMIYWGKYVDRVGSKNVLMACGLLIPLIPILWTLTADPYKLIFVEMLSGIIWAGFNLSVSTYIFDATDRRNRTRQVAEYTLLVQLAIFLGAMAGSGLLGLFNNASAAGFITIFILSGVLRLAVVLLFYKTIKEMRLIEIPVKDRIFKAFVTVRPQMGVIYDVAAENVKTAGRVALELPKKVNEEVTDFARKAQGIPKKAISKIRKMEQSEYEEDFQEYERKLKKGRK